MSTPEADGIVAFLERAERRLLDLSIEAQQADWVYQTYITPDSEALAARATSRLMVATAELSRESTRFPATGLPPSDARKLKLLRLSMPMVGPADPGESEELGRIVASMSGRYAKGRHVPRGASEPVDLQALSRLLEESRDPLRLEDAWTGWHRVGREIRPEFERYVALANRGARELGFEDTGAMWRSKYDLEPEAFAKEVERLWEAVRPLYASLHAYVRRRLFEFYGPGSVDPDGPIPAHLLGNMWAQSWEGIFPIVSPPSVAPRFARSRLLPGRKHPPGERVGDAERFFESLGFEPLPRTFWERSMFSRPRDREVVCHASAWDLDYVDDLRIKMCIEISGDEFRTVHHELGHNFYQRAYAGQPFLFRESAHDGFHEAIGDTVALSVTPGYLARIGLLDGEPAEGPDLGLLLRRALEKVAFLPFGLAVDKWRWLVFSGAVPPSEYNASWWALRREYQGIVPPGTRGEVDFDAGAKYHVPANVPYMRYFLAHILQFQFHRALARAMGARGPLHRVSIYGSEEAGRRLRATLAMGASREWPDALEALTGERTMSADGLLEYFAPLRRWLDDQNRAASGR